MKIKPPRRFYTADQLSERWECKVEDIDHLIEVGDLETTPYLAALHGKRNICIQVIADHLGYVAAQDKANTGETCDVVRFWQRPMSKEEYIQSILEKWMDQGPKMSLPGYCV